MHLCELLAALLQRCGEVWSKLEEMQPRRHGRGACLRASSSAALTPVATQNVRPQRNTQPSILGMLQHISAHDKMLRQVNEDTFLTTKFSGLHQIAPTCRPDHKGLLFVIQSIVFNGFMKEEQPPPQPPTHDFADPRWPENVADFIAFLTKYIEYRSTFVKK